MCELYTALLHAALLNAGGAVYNPSCRGHGLLGSLLLQEADKHATYLHLNECGPCALLL
jgi:hypothetical protein